MSLDCVLINKNNTTKIITISESLHKCIFCNSVRWSSTKILRKIKDYYKVDLSLKLNEISLFVNELDCIVSQLPHNCLSEMEYLIHEFTNSELKCVRVTGD